MKERTGWRGGQAIAAPPPTATGGGPVVAAAAGERTGTGWPATREKKWPSCFAAKRSGGAAPESTATTTSPSTGGCGGPDPPVAAENPDLSTSSDAPPSCSNRRSMARAWGNRRRSDVRVHSPRSNTILYIRVYRVCCIARCVVEGAVPRFRDSAALIRDCLHRSTRNNIQTNDRV